jgi:DNA-binding CsgD family transcriptional regulator
LLKGEPDLSDVKRPDATELWEAMRDSPFPFALIDPTSHIFVDVNEHYAALFGLKVANLKGLSLFSLYDAETAEAAAGLHQGFASGRLEAVRGQGLMVLHDGRAIELKGWERRIEGISQGMLVVTSATEAKPDKSVADDSYWVTQAPHVFGALSGDAPTASEQVAGDRAEQLEHHLSRIDFELRAAGLLPVATQTRGSGQTLRLVELTSRQREIVSRLLAGERVPEIARAIYLSSSTVRNHLSAVFRKFGVHSQVELITVLKNNE